MNLPQPSTTSRLRRMAFSVTPLSLRRPRNVPSFPSRSWPSLVMAAHSDGSLNSPGSLEDVDKPALSQPRGSLQRLPTSVCGSRRQRVEALMRWNQEPRDLARCHGCVSHGPDRIHLYRTPSPFSQRPKLACLVNHCRIPKYKLSASTRPKARRSYARVVAEL